MKTQTFSQQRSFSNAYVASPTSQLILHPFHRFTYVTTHSTALPLFHLSNRHFTYITAHSPTLPPLLLRHSSFYKPSAASPTSQVILQPFRRITYVTAHSTALPLLHLRHRHFTYVTVHSPTLLPLHLHHSSFCNPSADSPMSQVILQPFCCFSYVTGFSLTSPGEPSMEAALHNTRTKPRSRRPRRMGVRGNVIKYSK